MILAEARGERHVSKHMRRWQRVVVVKDRREARDMLTPVPTLSGRVVLKGQQVPIESRATKPRPWQTRVKNRARNRMARKSRKANRG